MTLKFLKQIILALRMHGDKYIMDRTVHYISNAEGIESRVL